MIKKIKNYTDHLKKRTRERGRLLGRCNQIQRFKMRGENPRFIYRQWSKLCADTKTHKIIIDNHSQINSLWKLEKKKKKKDVGFW